MPTYHVPKPADRPDVEALVDGEWRPGELRMWIQDNAGLWRAQAQRPPLGSTSRRIEAFPASRVRLERESSFDAFALKRPVC